MQPPSPTAVNMDLPTMVLIAFGWRCWTAPFDLSQLSLASVGTPPYAAMNPGRRETDLPLMVLSAFGMQDRACQRETAGPGSAANELGSGAFLVVGSSRSQDRIRQVGNVSRLWLGRYSLVGLAA